MSSEVVPQAAMPVVISIEERGQEQEGQPLLQHVAEPSRNNEKAFQMRMLEDTGGSGTTDGSQLILAHSTSTHPRKPILLERSAGSKSNLIQAAKFCQQRKTSKPLYQNITSSHHYARIPQIAKTAQSMSQFSRDRPQSDMSIKGRKLSPNTESGYQQSATGSDSGVKLIINRIGEGEANMCPSRQNNKEPLVPYSSEYMQQAKPKAISILHQKQQQRGGKTRSTSLLKHWKKNNIQRLTGSREQLSEAYTAQFAGIGYKQSQVHQTEKQVRKGSKMHVSQSEASLMKADSSFSVAGAAHSKRNVPALNLNIVSKQGKRQDTLAGGKSLMSQHSSLALQQKPPKSYLKGATNKSTNEGRKSILKPSSHASAHDHSMAKKKKQAQGQQAQFKPNAIANQRLMQQQKLADSRGTQGIKSSSALSKGHASLLNRSRSPRTGGPMYQSTTTDKTLKHTSSSLTHQQSQRQSLQQSRPLAQVNNFIEPRNESAGTGEQANMPIQGILKRASSSSSSGKHNKSVKQIEADSFSQKATISAAAPLKNSRSSFQLTFSRTGTTAQQPQQHAMLTVADQQSNKNQPGTVDNTQSCHSLFKRPSHDLFDHNLRAQATSQNLAPSELHHSTNNNKATAPQFGSMYKKAAASHSPRERKVALAAGVAGAASTSSGQNNSNNLPLQSQHQWSHLGEALKLYKVLQKQQASEHPAAASQDKSFAQKSQHQPYHTTISAQQQHSKSVIEHHSRSILTSKNDQQRNNRSKNEVGTFQSPHDSTSSISQSQQNNNNNNRAGSTSMRVMKKLLKTHEKKVVAKRDRLVKKKKNAKVNGGSYSPSAQRQEQQHSLLIQSQLAAAQSQKEWKEQKRRVKELRQQRKAIEAKTREIKLKSMKQQQQSIQMGHAAKTVRKITDMQQISSHGPAAAEAPKKGLKTPGSYTQVRSNNHLVAAGKSQSSNDLLSAVGFQRHYNMPLQIKPSRQIGDHANQHQQKLQNQISAQLPRNRSTSSERVEWDPSVKKHSAPLHVSRQASTKAGSAYRNARGQRKVNQKMVERDLAMELPLAQNQRKVKNAATPTSLAILSRQTGYTGKKRILKESTVNRISDKSMLESERESVQHERCINVEELFSKQMRMHPHTLEPPCQESERQPMSREKSSKLVEQQKRIWLQKQRELQTSQLNEQQRILKNLQHVNKVARNQAIKAGKQTRKEKQEKALRSARAVVARKNAMSRLERENYNAEKFVDKASRSSSERPILSLSQKKDAKDEKQEVEMINLKINSGKERRHGSQKSSARAKSTQGGGGGYISPRSGRQMMIGTTGGQESDQEISNSAHKSSQTIKRNSALSKQGKPKRRDQQQTSNLKPVTLYQLQCQNGLTLNEENRRQSSLSQHNGGELSNSSNLNYSPTTTLEKRSDSQSTKCRGQNGGVFRSESPTKSRTSKRSSRIQNRLKSTESKKSNGTNSRKAKQRTSTAAKQNAVNRFAQNQRIKERLSVDGGQSQQLLQGQEVQQSSDPDLDKEDLVVFVIITQAARMIQRAFRAYLSRKRHQKSRDYLRQEVEEELLEARRQGLSSASKHIQNRTSSLKSISSPSSRGLSPVYIQATSPEKQIQNLAQQQLQQQRKHTFSFGQQNDSQSGAFRSKQASIGSSQKEIQKQCQADIGSSSMKIVEGRESAANTCDQNAASETASFDLQRNVQLNLRKMQLPITLLDNGVKSQFMARNGCHNSQFVEDGGEQTQEEESMLYFEQIPESQQDVVVEESGESRAYEAVERPNKDYARKWADIDNQDDIEQNSAENGGAEDDMNAEVGVEASFDYASSQQCSDDVRSQLVVEAGEETSLQNTLDDQKKAAEESMMGSVALRTDNIINDSGALNTSEEFNDVNASGTLGPANPYSIVSSGTKPVKQPILPKSNNQVIPAPPNRKSAESDESSFEQPAMMLGNQYNLETVVRNQQRRSEHAMRFSGDQSRKKLMRMVSGDERFLNSYSSRLPYQSQSNDYTNTETQKEALQIISQLNSGVGGAGATTNQGNQSLLDDYQLVMGRMDDNSSSFQNAFYPNCMQSSIVQNLSQVSIEQEESKDFLQLLKQNGINPHAYQSTQNSYFLHTNASIFERNPFQDFTTSKIHALVTKSTSSGTGTASGSASGSVDYNGVDQLVQMREDALKYITQLEQGWIARQESMKLLSPSQSHRRRYELEQWVNTQRQSSGGASAPAADGPYRPSPSQVRHFCSQVCLILETVNKKADEIREQLYQRSQDSRVKQQQIQGYQEMHLYKKALGIGAGGPRDEQKPTGEIKSLDNIDVIDQSQEEVVQIGENQEEQNERENNVLENELEISIDQSEDLPEDKNYKTEEAPNAQTEARLNADILPTPPSDTEPLQAPAQGADAPSLNSSDANERLAEEITDRILTQLLNDELSTEDLRQVFNRSRPQAKMLQDPARGLNADLPMGSGAAAQPLLEVVVSGDRNFNINQSISCDQIIAGVDTSLDAVQQYVEGIFSQIRIRAKQFMNAFYTPIYRNPMTILAKIQKQGLLPPGQKQSVSSEGGEADLFNTLSSILNVQLYLTLEKARENVIRDALQQIKEAATADQDLAIDSNLSELLSESDHIHNKAIFDAVNEALNLVRPYGRLGEPMPWSQRARKNFFPFANEKDLDGVLDSVKKCIFEWADIRAGQISTSNIAKEINEGDSPQKDDSAVEGLEAEQNENKNEASLIKQTAFCQIGEETLALQREKSLAKLLTQEIASQEERWLDYETEETQVKIDLSDFLLEHLVDEIVTELTTIGSATEN